MNFLREYKSYLKGAAVVWLVSLVLCLAAYMFVLRPQSDSKRRLDGTLVEQKQLYASARRAAQKQTQNRLNEQIQRLRDRLGGFAVDREELTDLTFDITQIANRENLDTFSVTPRGKKRNTGGRGAAKEDDSETNQISENLIDIKFTGGFHQFAAFVNALERHRPVLFIDEFKIDRSKKNNSLYRATLDVAALVRKPRDNETAETTSASAFSAKL